MKVCSAPDCSHVQPVHSKKNLCSKHPSTSTDKTSDCPVVFMYLFPLNFTDDHRRYVQSNYGYCDDVAMRLCLLL